MHLDEQGLPEGETRVADEPRMSGGGAFWDAERQQLVAIGFALDEELQVVVYDADLQEIESHFVLISQAPERAYWPQGLLLIQDTWVVAHMLRDDATWAVGDEGDVALAFFDRDWQLKEQVRLTDNALDGGGQRPWMALDGEQLLVAYDRQQELTLIPVALDLSQFSAVEDTGANDTGANDTGPNDTGTGPGESCGCTQNRPGPAGVWLLGLGLLLLRRREL
ncbi:MAG: hypothetical protein ACI9VR_004573 [Cognaticolwellia sp.]